MHRAISKRLALILCFAILATPAMGFFHGLISHTHTHGNALHIELWEGLHSALTRKDLVDAVLTPLVFFVLGFVVLVYMNRLVRASAFSFSHSLVNLLRRGVLAYRRFG